MKKTKSSNLSGYFLNFCKVLVVHLIVFQMFTQPIAALAQSKSGLQIPQPQRIVKDSAKSNIKAKVEEDNVEDFLPNLENKTRKAVSDAFGVNIPLPQVFGENGKLSSLLSGATFSNDKNKELIDLALNNGNGIDSKPSKTKIEKISTETAISLNAPILNSGLIDGSLRVTKEVPFNLNDNFRITENLLTVGSPDISTQENSEIKSIVDEESDDLSSNYQVYVHGGKIDGNIHIHSIAENIFKDIPTALPQPTGNENVEINSAEDIKNIKDWSAVRNITINAANLTIPIPAGNYENLALNAPNKLVFADGNYNFSDTINVHKESLIQINGKATIGIGKNLILEQASIKTGEHILADDVKINVLGSSVILSGTSEIEGLLRAANGNVILNDQSKISGQVIASSLIMNGGTVTKFSSNGRAVFSLNTDDNIAVVKEGLTVNGQIEGSVQQLLAQNTILNSNAVITGDLLIPGVPQITQNGTVNFGGIITGTGSPTPTSHRVTLNSNSTLRKLKTRIDPITLPTIPTPPASSGTVNVIINNPSQYPTSFSNIRDITMNSNAGVLTVPPGTYRNFTVNSGSGMKFGVAGQTTPMTYNLNSFVINSNSQIQIVSPVILNLATGLTLNASVGVLNSPEWLKVNVTTGNVTLNGNSSLYGGVIAPTSIVTINANTFLIGNVVCKNLVVNSGGVLRNVLPNLLSDTSISITSPANNSATTNNSITVSGTANSSIGIAGVFVNNQPAVFNSSTNTWTISNVALTVGSNIITARTVDNSGTEAVTQINVTRQPIVDTTPPVISISSPANNSTTPSQTITVSGTAADLGTNASGLASVTVNGQPAALSGNGNWTISGVALNTGSNTITARAADNAGNYANATVTITRIIPDTTPPTLAIISPANNSNTTNATISVSGTVSDSGSNPSGVQSVTVNGQPAVITGNNWTIGNIALTVGANVITVNALDNAGNSSNQQITVTRTESDTTAPTVTISSPANNFETVSNTITVSGTAIDSGTNASGVASVTVNGINAVINGGTWTAANVPLNLGSNTITATARDNSNNVASTSITVVRNPLDTTAPTITITSPVNNFETFDSQIVVSGTAVDTGAGATGVRSVTVNGVLATYNVGTNDWTTIVSLVNGVNVISVVAIDNAPTPNQSGASIQVTKSVVQPPTLTLTNPQNGAFLSANSVTVAGNVSSNKPDMTFTVTVNGEAANLAGREFTKTVNLTDGANVITVVATDALGQSAQQSITVTNDRTPPTVYLINVPPVAGPGASYTIGAVASDVYGIADVEFTVNGTSVLRSSVAPYQFTLNIPLNQAPNVNLNISAIARDNAGLSATATARIVTSGPSGLTGYVFDDATGFVLPNVFAGLNGQSPILTNENGLYSFVSTTANGNILLAKAGYTAVERSYSATAGSGVEVFDTRLTPLDSKVNTADVNGSINASDFNNKIQVQFAISSFASGTDVRITPISPQGLANLLPFGWSPIPDAVVDIRTAAEVGFSNQTFANPASLTIPQVAGLPSNLPIVLARYNSTTHNWVALQTNLFAGENGRLQVSISASGQYAFLIADTGATAPPSAVSGQNLPAAVSADSEQLDAATATAFASPALALYSNTAKSRINFVADSVSKLPSGVAIEASFSDSYLTLIDRNLISVDRPSQDFVLYSFPSVSITEPNKLGAFFVAKPIRTDFALTDLLNAKIHVDIRSGRLSQAGVLIGTTGGIVRGAEGSELEIPSGAVNASQVVFFNKIPNNQTGITLPPGYETVGAFELNLAGNALTQTAKISMPSIAGDNEQIVVAKVISIGGQPGLKVVGRVVENNVRLESRISQPSVPSGINLVGIRDGGKYLFVRMPGDFGYVRGVVSSSTPPTQSIKITNTNTPFVDIAANNGSYTILGLATGANIQVDAVSLNNDATGFGTTTLSAQDGIANLPISLSSAVLNIQTVTPTNAAANVIVTTPITITFNKPILGSTVTGSNIKLVTASGNPVITTMTMLAGGRSVILTPSANLQSETNYKVQVSTGIRDIYGNALINAFESTFRTANTVTVGNQLQPALIRISYPNEQGLSTISIPAGAVPSGSLIFAINNSTGNTVSTIAGSGAIELLLQARVGDDIELIIRQPDGTEYRVKQAAYRRTDGFVSVGANGGTITSDDGSLVLQVPPGAISGQADVKMTFAPESGITTPREGEMSPTEMSYIGGVKIETQGNFTNNEELHLELPAPANVAEGSRALVMKPSRVNYNGSEFDSWETITSAKVEGGKIKTTSPPFFGVTLVGALISVSLLSFYIFIPQRQRVVTGLVRKQKADGTYENVAGAICSIATPNGENPRTYATSQSNGKFAISHNSTYYPSNADIPVLCVSSGVPQSAIAYLYNSTEPGVIGFETRYANIIFPPTSIVNQPPQISIAGRTLGADGNPLPEESDPLRLFGKVQVGATVEIFAGIIPSTAQITSQQLIVNGAAQNLDLGCQVIQQRRNCSKLIPTPTAGRYSVVIKARTDLNSPLTESTAIFNFIVLNNPNVRPSIRGVNPAVVSVLPADGASQIDVGASIHIEFSEPVKNLRSGGVGETVYLVEEGLNGQSVSGRIFSGGIPVTPTDAKSVIDFTPNNRLKSGKSYRVVITTDVIDISEGDPNVVPPIPADPNNLRYLDQDTTQNGLQQFNSRFRTFEGSVITPTPINAQGFKIAVLDDLVVTTNPNFNGIASSGTMKIYDSTEFIGTDDPQNLQPVSSLYIPHVPLGLAARKEIYTIGGIDKELNLIAVTTLSMDTERPRNIWFYNIDERSEPHLVGVVSLVANGNSGQVPNSISIERKRAYIGSSSNGGVFVVDIQQAIDAFGAEDNTPDDGNEYNNTPVLRAVAPSSQSIGGGFGQSAIMQRATYLGANDSFQVYNTSTITQSLLPFAYITSNKQKLLSFNFGTNFDGINGYLPGGQNGTDRRVTANKDPLPVSSFYDLKAVSGLQIQNETKDIAVGVAANLWIFDVSNPAAPKQYPISQNPNDPQMPAKSFAELGVPSAVGGFGKQVVIEETLVYVLFENGVAVFDISNPNDPYLTTLIRGLTGLRYFAVKDGFIYTLGTTGLNVSIGRGVAQVITYGFDPNAPDEVCGNPVVISKANGKMVQPAGIFFQLLGQDTPSQARVVIRKVQTVNGNRTETEITTITVDPNNLRVITNPANGFNIVIGSTIWEDAAIVIDRTATYTAEVVINNDFRSKQVEIPFSNLLPDDSFQKEVKLTKLTTSVDENGIENKENVGSLMYLLAGNSIDVEFKINGSSYPLYDIYQSTRQPKTNTRAFGANNDYLVPRNLGDGLYPFSYKAKLKANPAYSEEISGTVKIGNDSDEERKPGSTVVNGVEINSGNLAISENDISIKGRGLSLDFTRSYNSHSSDTFGTLGYGWSHTYQVSLVRTMNGYQMLGGEGSNQKFLDADLQNGVIKAKAPFLGKLVKNADGTFDYFTKSQTKYHFRQAFEQINPSIYLGSLEYIEEPNRNRIQLFYDIFGRLSSVADSSNRRLNFEYEAADNVFTGINIGDVIPRTQGCPKINQYKQITKRLEQSVTGKAWRIKQITSPNTGGLTIDYIYDVKGNLVLVNRDGTDSTISEPTASREWKYVYNPSPTLDEKYSHLLKTVKSPNNAADVVTEYKYFLTGTAPPRVMQIVQPETVTNSFTYTYNATTNVVDGATFTDGNANLTTYELEDFRVKTITAPLGAITRLEWTAFGQIRKTTDPEGKITEIVFDANNNPSTQTLTGGTETIATVTTFDTKFSKMSSFKDGNGNLTNYAISLTTGNVDEITLANGRSVIFSYFPNGDLKDVTDQYGTLTQFSNYDGFGNPQTITKNLGGGQTQVITQTFDARSRQRSKADSLGTDTTIDYDGLDRPTKQIMSDPAGYRNSLTTETIYLPEGQTDLTIQRDGATEINRVKNLYDKLQRLNKTTETVSGYATPFVRNFTYDSNSNLISEQNRRGVTTGKSYNALNHLTRIVQGTKTVWEATVIDKVGNPKTVKDLYGNQTIYVYDGLQRLTNKQLPESVTEKLEYDDNNNITASFDRNNNKTEYIYDRLNRIDTVKDALGRETKWTYTDVEHKVEKEFISNGLKETTVMDGLERPVSQTVKFGGTTYLTTYLYDGRNVTMTDPRGTEMKQKLSGFGETGEMEVVGANPVYKTTAYYSALGAIRQMTDALNRVTTCVNDGFNRKRNIDINGEFSESWNYDGEGLLTDHRDKRTVLAEMSYDELGRKLSTKVKGTASQPIDIEVEKITYTDASSIELMESAVNNTGSRNPMTYKYDGLRRVKQITNSESNSKNFVYDGENLKEESDFYNRRTRYEYDALNRVIAAFDRNSGQTRIVYAADELTKTTTDRRGNITTESYDQLGRLLTANSYGKLASFSYDGNNNRLTQQDGLNNETSFEYDKLNRLTKITHPNALQIERMTYDAVGNVKTHDDGRGGIVESLRYDALNQLEEVKDGIGNINKFDYDGGGLLLSKTEPKGIDYTTNYKYNAFGSVTEITEPEQLPWMLSYDDKQNMTAVKDPLNRMTGYDYDIQNRLQKTTQPLGRISEYTYDRNSNIATMKDAKGQIATMTYTVLDNPDTASYKDEVGTERLRHQYNYDAEENLWQVTENRSGYSSRNYTRQFDTRNRLTKTTDAYNKSVDFGYDTANNLTLLRDASSRVTNYNYDAKNQLDKVFQSSLTIADYDWYEDGLLKQVRYSATSKRDYSYDNADRVTNITNTIGTGSESFDYGYDSNSNRNSEIRKIDGTVFKTANYGYDKLNRLTSEGYTANTTTNQINFTYDAVGNRITEIRTNQSGAAVNKTATYDDLNRLTNLTQSGLVNDFEYDGNSNLTKVKLNNVDNETFEYDVRNQLSRYTSIGNGTVATFDYDFERKRLSKTSSGVRRDYVYAGSQVISEFQNNVASASYSIGAGEIVRSEFANEGTRFYFSDALGSTTSLADASSSLISRNDYDAFGEIVASSGSTSNSIGYTGQRLDAESGLMALGNGERYYNPSYGRFIQQDSFAGVPSIPQSLNRFSYAHNNPNKYTDPSGNFIPLIIGAALLIGALVLLATDTYSSKVNHDLARAEGREQDNGSSTWALGLSDATGATQAFRGFTGTDAYTGKNVTGWQRAWDAAAGTAQVILNATVIGGAVFKVGSITVNTIRGGVELAELTKGAWSSFKGVWGEIKDAQPFIEDVKSIISKVRNPIDTIKSGYEAGKNTLQGAKESVSGFINGGGKETAKRAWEFTKERLNPFNYERNGANVNFNKYSVGKTQKTLGVKYDDKWKKTIWDKDPTQRGVEIEEYLAQTEYKGWYNVGAERNGFFEAIDFSNEIPAQVISLKSLDPINKGAYYRLKGYVDDLADAGNITIGNKSAKKILDVRVRPGVENMPIKMSSKTEKNLQDIIGYGRDADIEVRISPFGGRGN